MRCSGPISIANAAAGAVLAASWAAPSHAVAPCPPAAIPIEVGQSIDSAAQAAPEGAAFCIRAGIHRSQSIHPKTGQAFIGEPGAILNGSIKLGDFLHNGRFWHAGGITPRGQTAGDCLKTKSACNRSDGVYVDGVPLEPVAALGSLRPGTFYFDHAARQLWLANNPRGKLVELAATERAFHASAAHGVVIRDLIVEKYANPAQQGAISTGRRGQPATGWRVENNEVRFNTGVGVAAGPDSVIRGNRIHHNGQLGITSTANNVLIEDNEISYNNIYGFDADWEAGGLKAAIAENMTVRRNRVFENRGAGIWCDIDCKNVTIEDNTVERNSSAGIFYEISSDGIIRNNSLQGNGAGGFGQKGRVWVWGAEILVAASSRVEVSGNRLKVMDKSSGVMLIEQGRKKVRERADFYKDSDGYFVTSDVHVHNNLITYAGRNGVSGGATDVSRFHPNASVIQNGNNRFDFNTYTGAALRTSKRFMWGRGSMTFDEFRALGHEAHGAIADRE